MKKVLLLSIITIMLFATGCTTKSESLNKPIEPLEGFTNTEYNKETDHQSFFHENADLIRVEKGYIVNSCGFLYYIDDDTHEPVELCSNIDCEHNFEECDSYIEDGSFIQYYDGDIYYVGGYDGNELYRKTLDGSMEEKICSFNTQDVWPTLHVHRGYGYYSLQTGNDSAALFRVELKEGAKPEMIYKGEGYYAGIIRIKGYGDGVLFVKDEGTDKEFSDIKFTLLYYDCKKDAVFSVTEDISYDYVVHDNKIYYTTNGGIYCYDAEAKKNSFVAEAIGSSIMSCDGKYIYYNEVSLGGGIEETSDGRFIYYSSEDDTVGTVIDPEDAKVWGQIKVIDFDGNLVDVIDKGKGLCLFGDEKNLFRMTDLGIAMFDKSQIGTENHEWIEINLTKE